MLSAFTILLHLFTLALPAEGNGGFQARLAKCEQNFRQEPLNYGHARCFFVATEDFKGAQNIQATRNKLQELQKEYPKNCRLDVILSHFHGDHAPDLRVAGYHAAAQKAVKHNDVDCEIIARNNICIHHFFNGNPRLGDAQAYRVLELGHAAQDLSVWARGISNFANHFTRDNRNLGAAYEEMRKLRKVKVKDLGDDIKRDLYINRARLARVFFEQEQAMADLHDLYALGKPTEDVYAIMVAAQGIAGIQRDRFLKKVSQHPSFAQVHQRFQKAIKLAQHYDQIRYEARMLEEMAAFLSSRPETLELALDAVQDCLDLSQGAYPNLFGICLARRSEITAQSNPKQSFLDAQHAVETLSSSGAPELSAYGWRQIMRRLWELGDHRDFLAVAHAALARIDHLLYSQKDPLARRQTSSLWTDDFYWVASRLLLDTDSPERVRQAFEISDQVRGRYLLDLIDPDRAQSAYDRNQKDEDPFAICEFCSSPTKEAKSYEVFEQPAYQSEADTEIRTFADLMDQVRRYWHKRNQNGETWSKELQSQLAADEVLIAYQISTAKDPTAQGIRGFVVRQDAIHTVALPLKAQQIALGTRIVRDQIQNRDPEALRSAQKLQQILVDPLKPYIPASAKRLIIVPDGPLSALPFSLLLPQYNTSVAPSARAWLKFRSTRKHWGSAEGLIVVDPQRGEAQRSVSSIFAYRSWTDELQDSPLPESRKEVDHIMEHLGGNMHSLIGEHATKSKVLANLSSHKNLLHISAHSFVNINSPDESAIVLSNHDQGRDFGNDLLRIREIEALDLEHTFVVLGGCSTGWGAAVSGEGVLSIASAFQRAGAPAVLASLWPVRDEEASDFFDLFYWHLGQSKRLDEALRETQREFEQRGLNPADYAGFILLGDGSLRFKSQRSPHQKLLTATGLAGLTGLLVGLWLLSNRRSKRETKA